METHKNKTLQYKKGSHPPVSPTSSSRKISDKLLTPMAEEIRKPLGDKPLYSNKAGDVFTVSTVYYPEDMFEGPSPTHIVIEEISKNGEKPYKVTTKVLPDSNTDSLSIFEIHNSSSVVFRQEEPFEDRKGYGFFAIVLEHAKKLARQLGFRKLTITPANDKLGDHYAKFGFGGNKLRMELTLD